MLHEIGDFSCECIGTSLSGKRCEFGRWVFTLLSVQFNLINIVDETFFIVITDTAVPIRACMVGFAKRVTTVQFANAKDSLANVASST